MLNIEELRKVANHVTELSEFNFMELFFYKLRNKKIITISRFDLENKLYYYKQNKEYELLFNNIEIVKYREMLELGNALYFMKINNVINDDRIPYQYIITGKTPSFNTTDEINYLMDKLVDDYISKKHYEESFENNKVAIFSINPNYEYVLYNGEQNGNTYVTTLFTDGNISACKTKIESSESIFATASKMIFQGGHNLKQLHIDKLTIENANYVAVYKKYNDNDLEVNIYTDKNNLVVLESIISEIKNDMSNHLTNNEEKIRRL